MAEAESLLGEQQRAALEIPYKNIEQFQKSLGEAFNAFGMTRRLNIMQQEVDRKTRALERQLEFKEQQLAEKTSQDEFLDKVRMINAETSARGRDIAEQRLQIYAMTANNKLDEKDRQLQQTSDAAAYMLEAGEAGRPGHPRFPDTFLAMKRMFPDTKGTIEDGVKMQNAATSEQRKGIATEFEHASKTIGKNVYGEGREPDMRPFLDPDRFTTPDYRTEQTADEKAAKKEPVPAPRGASFRYDAATKKQIPVKFETDKHGNLIQADSVAIPVAPRTATEKDPFVHVQRKDFTEYVRQLADIKKRQDAIPPELTVTPSGGAIQIFTPKERDRLQPGDTFFWVDPNDPNKTRHYGIKN